MKPKVLLDPHFRGVSQLFQPEALARLHEIADVAWGRDAPAPEAEIAAVREEVVAIVTGGWRYGDVAAFPRLRAILDVAGGFPSPSVLDYDTCFSRGIRVLTGAVGFGPAVAEMALCMALATARGVVAQDRAFRTGREAWGHRGKVEDFLLFDKPVGFIGFGNIGRALKPLLAPFRCPIRVYDPWLTDAYLATQGVLPAPLEELLDRSRVVFVLAVPTSENRALLDRAALERLRPEQVLVLISRSHLADFDALTELVLAGRFRAAIDVFPTEPLPPDHPIREAEGAILSPHRAGGGRESYHLIGRMVVNDLEAILRGLPPQELQAAQPEYIRGRG